MPVIAILAAALVRAWDLDHMSLWTDEGLSFYRAAQSLPGLVSGRIDVGLLPTRDVQPPLYFLVLAGWSRLVGLSPWTAKALSWMASLALVALVWAVARRLAGRRAAPAVAVLASLSPVYLWYSQEVRGYTVVAALAALSTLALARASGVGGRARPGAWIAWIAASLALVWSHYLGFLLLGAQALIVAFVARPGGLGSGWPAPRAARRGIAALAMASLLALPLIPFALARLRLGAERDQHYVPLEVILADVGRNFALGLTAHFQALPWLPLAAWAVALAGAWRLRQRPRRLAILLAGLAGPVLGLYALTLVKPVYMGVRHILLASPAFYALAGAGLAWPAPVGPLRSGLLPTMVKRILASAATLVVAGGMAWADIAFYHDADFAKDDLRGLAAYVDGHAIDGDVLVLSDPVLLHTFRVMSRVPLAAVPLPADQRTVDEQLADLAGRARRVWFMTPGPEAEDWLERNLQRVDRQSFHSSSIPVWVVAYESVRLPNTTPAADPASQAADGIAGDLGGIAVGGWTVLPQPLASGQPARVNLVMSRTGPIDDFKLALRLVGRDGRDYAEGDQAPFHGHWPVPAWERGEPVHVPADLLVSPAAPAGDYELRLRVYNHAGQELLGSADLILGWVEVERSDRPAVVPLPGQRVEARGGPLELEAVRVPGPPWLEGAARDVEVFARATGAAASGWRLAVSLVGPGGREAARATTLPFPDVPEDDVTGLTASLRPEEPGRFDLVARLVAPDGTSPWLRLGRLGLVPSRRVRLATVDVLAVTRRQELPAMDARIGAVFGDTLELVGYRYRERPDGTEVTLVWRADAEPDRDFVVSVQRLPGPAAGDHRPVAQHDGEPADGSRPTGGWRSGEIIEDVHLVPPPDRLEPGPQSLIVAVYDPDNGARMPVRGVGAAGDHAILRSAPLEGGP